MAQTGRGRRTHPEIVLAIRDLAADGLTAQQIQDRLDKAPEYSHLSSYVPASLRTIQHHMKGLPGNRTPEDPWRMSSMSMDDVQVLRPLMVETVQERDDWLSQREAEWAVRVLRLIPKLSTREAYHQAHRAARAEQDGDLDTLRELEILFLMNPWDPETGARGRYLDMIDSDVVRGQWFLVGAAGRRRPSSVDGGEDVDAQRARVAETLSRRRARA